MEFKDKSLFAPVVVDEKYEHHPFTDDHDRGRIAKAQKALVDYVFDVVLNKRKTKDRHAVRVRELVEDVGGRGGLVSDAVLFPYSDEEPWEWHAVDFKGQPKNEPYFSGRVFGCHTEVVFSENNDVKSVYIEVD